MNETIIMKCIFGSHLYGTETETSDRDYKGIFLPSKKSIFLGKIPKSYNHTTKKGNDSRNTIKDVDTEIYSLHYFIQLACEGQTVALDMLHVPENMLLESSKIWKNIISNKKLFYTKNLKAFVGYARRQAAKYGIKGGRLNAAKNVIELLRASNDTDKMANIWDSLPIGSHLYMIETNKNGIRQYQVCGKIIQETATVGYVLTILEKFYAAYGKRAFLAAKNEGIDWKAVSHALRAAYQTRQLLTKQNITFPLAEASFLLKVKKGKVDYKSVVAPTLNKVMDEVEILSKESSLPEKVNREFWDGFIIKTIEEYVL